MWSCIEEILLEQGIKPILAVVPDNHDPKLQVQEAKSDFWGIVRGWQSLGWSIGIHGYQHLYSTDNPGIMGLNAYSEFAGLSEEVQRDKLMKAISIFKRERVVTESWIAPAHSFDSITVGILLELGVQVISDGYFWQPYRDRQGMIWVPQQLWRFYDMPLGLWTVGFHHNSWTGKDLDVFHSCVKMYKSRIDSLDDVLIRHEEFRPHWAVPICSLSYLMAVKIKRLISCA